MASSSCSSNPFLSASLSLVFFFFFLCFESNKSFASAIREERTGLPHHTHSHHLIPLSSLFPSSSCSSPPPGGSRKGWSLEVVHKHGPCSRHTPSSSLVIPHTEILRQDQVRARAIRSRISQEQRQPKQNERSEGLEQSLEALLPARSGINLGTGDYFVTVGLGSPTTELSLIFDTGSDLTWTQCQPCELTCYTQKDRIFDPSHSSSYSNISCPSSQCSQLSSATGIVPPCSATRACEYDIRYADQSSSIGLFAKETLTITPNDVIDNFLFGCGQGNHGLFGRTAGILGLGRNPISFVEQTAGMFHKIFSYCIPSTSSDVGFLTFGGASASNNIGYTPFSSIPHSSSFYALDITGITLAGTDLPISASVFSSGMIIDSGTVITRLPPAAYDSLRDAFRNAMSMYPKADPVLILDTCYDLSSQNNVVVPKVTLWFEGGVNVDLDASGVLLAVSETQVCLAFAGNDDASQVAILGNTQQKTLEVVYDVDGGKIGFRPGGCRGRGVSNLPPVLFIIFLSCLLFVF